MARTKFKKGDQVVYRYGDIVKVGVVEEVKKVEHLGKVAYWVRFPDRLSGIIYARNLHKPRPHDTKLG